MRQAPLFLTKFIVLLGLAALFLPTQITSAQAPAAIQEVVGELEPGAVIVYLLPDLVEGQTFYAYAAGTSGNLDPFLVLVDGDANPIALRDEFRSLLDQAISAGEDPVTAIDAAADELYLAFNDDSGHGYDASLAFTAPADGSYLLAIGSSLLQPSAGGYRLLIGLDTPEVLGGDVEPTTDDIVTFQEDLSRLGVGVQELTGALSAESDFTFYTLHDLQPGETFYARVEATSGDLAPVLILEDFGEKPVIVGKICSN